MNFFELQPEDSQDYEIYAEHPWGLPGVRCDVCGETWSNVGISYPAVDLSSLPNASRYKNLAPVDRRELAGLAEAVRPLVPAGCPLPPGTDFGPLDGNIRGKVAELAWQHAWTLLLGRDVWKALHTAGSLRAVGADVRLRQRGSIASLVELQIEPHGRLADECLPEHRRPIPCAGCGRVGLKRPTTIVLDSASVERAPEIFRLGDLTTVIVVREELANAFQSLGLHGTRYLPLAVA